MSIDGNNPSIQSKAKFMQSSRPLNLKIKSFLRSRTFPKTIFIIVLLFHFLVYWFLGVFVYVETNLQDLIAYKNIFFAFDFKQGIFDLFDIFRTNPALLYATSTSFAYNSFLELPGFMFYVSFWAILSRQWLVLGTYQSVIVYDFVMFLWNLGDCYLIYKIMNSEKIKSIVGNRFLGNPFILMSLYIGTSMAYFDYYFAQHNALAGFLLLLGVYYLVNGKEHFTYFIWGIGMYFKAMLLIFVIIFILHGSLKKFAKNGIFFIISQVPNFILFAMYPPLISGYINNNLNRMTGSLLLLKPVNIAQFLLMFFNISFSLSEPIIFSCLLPFFIYILIECKKSMNILDKFMFVTLLSINLIPGEPDHTLIFLGIFLGWIATKNPRLHGSVRYLKITLAIPFLSGLFWLIFPYFAIIYFGSLIWMGLLILFSKETLPINVVPPSKIAGGESEPIVT